jgi:LacI family transcriptional regulator
MPIKLRDVAARLNLSPSLVSGVLNDRPGVWASEETRRRIQETAREMGYQPNAAARALRSGKTNTVGLFYLNPAQFNLGPAHLRLPPGYEGVTEVLAEYLGARGYRLAVNVFAEQRQLLAALEDACQSQSCDAVVLWGREPDIEAQGCVLERFAMPFVVKGRHERKFPHWPQIDFDHEALAANCVAHLARRGHRRIAYIGYDNGEVFTFRLLDGYRAAMRTLLDVTPPEETISSAGSEIASAAAQMQQWLALPPELRPTAAVIGASSNAWYGLELALARQGCRLGHGPNDFAAAGVGREDLCLLFGEGYVFQHIELADLMVAMGDRLLMPLLAGEPLETTVLRILPELGPTRGWNLLEYASFPSLNTEEKIDPR